MPRSSPNQYFQKEIHCYSISKTQHRAHGFVSQLISMKFFKIGSNVIFEN